MTALNRRKGCTKMVRDGSNIRPCGAKPTRDGLCFRHHPTGKNEK